MKLCEAAAMDAAHFGNWDAPPDWVPPCDEMGVLDRHGYLLCEGCATALDELGALARGARERRAWARLFWLRGLGQFVAIAVLSWLIVRVLLA